MLFRRLLTTKVGYHTPNYVNRRLILSVLKSTATRREAKDYLTKYGDPAVAYHCVLYLRGTKTFSAGLINDFAIMLGRLRLLGIRPLVVLSPSKHVMTESEILRETFYKHGLQSIPINEPMASGTRETILQNGASYNSIIPIIMPFVYHQQRAKRMLAEDEVAFMRELVAYMPCRIDKFFIINRYGGIPSSERHDNSHVFVNLSQEYGSLAEVLKQQITDLRHEMDDGLLAERRATDGSYKEFQYTTLTESLTDLELMSAVLSLLLPSSTGLITSMHSAVTNSRYNPLLYNVLTDRSLVSSSLPSFKRDPISDNAWYELPACGAKIGTQRANPIFSTTVLKQGVDIKLYDYSTLTKENSVGFHELLSTAGSAQLPAHKRVNLTKLKGIIEHSFDRNLDMSHYLKRINGKIASIIVIGDYEGIAILTYEGPEKRPFAYLDKFAVLPHLRGSLCISDVIFNLMFKKFGDELVWRSRRENVVNNWYFQRSVGVLDLSIDIGHGPKKDNIFKLFYYGGKKGTQFYDFDRLREYITYVRDIEPSWSRK
ncbi:ADR120Cp [Eremothecium gossypii ATCC 10895]|uniref:Amino-acid acetyltransferase, mitochondrial n=1 Tax=Eremothecium gossypii (strain ATCC 10895 / CBS 109.51 / FGSC 9923 / NRRL Y-1056) TaxID=284811 RepID=NAGS_EREGS|nr:ADR120Cp [Eremothecium gossypii ATCC 10895]Q75A07.1 RecName: Full=Amino-acid acetyltransferase, mitochondrial; AltName: Full=Arginine-requiring protein 2; AltName: Full=Glutamate N-acetyltransferase; AltName: Full=N-acetylglutamate synthase; Short=AGS; Short=NAGS; Flags: Precursor [Eremothecium gossypii ATCC 10895]AAS52040.1 ADR120Cp [Eremothecium gossypii ATCC 10895]